MKKVLIQEQVYEWIKMHQGKARLETIINKIESFIDDGERTSQKEQKLFVGQRIYKTRFNHSDRLIYSVDGQPEDDNVRIKLLRIGNHKIGDEAYQDREKLVSQSLSLDFIDDWNNETEIEKNYCFQPLSRDYIWCEKDGFRLNNNNNAELWWRLDDEQDEIRAKTGPVILRGSAGSGKTTIALYRLMDWLVSSDAPCLYITYSEKLKKYAEIHFSQLKREDRQVLFKTIDELCLGLLPEDKKTQFKHEHYVSLVKFDKFIQKRNQKFSTHMLWEEFRGVLKGCYYLAESKQQVLTLEQYQDLRLIKLAQDDSLFESGKDRKEVYQLFEMYQEWLKAEDKWDDLDLARCAFEYSKNNRQPYAQILVDEVQDLTTFHLQIILQLTSHPETLFLTGDAHQSIHPSRFRWERLKDQIFSFLQEKKEKRYFGKTTNNVQQVKKNYRCSKEIIQLVNTLSSWRSEFFKDDKEQLEAIDEEASPVGALKYSLADPDLLEAENLAVSVMILVSDDDEKEKLTDNDSGVLRHCTNNVFSIHESKGLESDTVILYGFFDKHEIFSKQFYGNHKKGINKEQKHQLRYLVNLFNVACTRARFELILIDTDLPEWLPLTAIKHRDDEIVQDLLENILARKSSDEEYLKQAQKLEENHNWQQAAATWKKINRMQDHHRCWAIFYEEREEWLNAAQHYHKAKLLQRAYDIYEKIESYQDSLIVLLEMSPNQRVADKIEDIFNTPKKIAKIKDNFGQKILEKILEENSSISTSILFRYSTEKTRLFRESVRKNQREINHQLFLSKAAEERNRNFHMAIQQFSALVKEM